MSEIKLVIHWFRRDLRLSDNLALEAASKSGFPILPVFVLDPRIVESHKVSVPRLAFLLKALEALDHHLRQQYSRLFVFYGIPHEVIKKLIERTDAKALYFNKDYTPFALKRDEVVCGEVSVPIYMFNDGLLLSPGSVINKADKPFTVFTPFKKQWLAFEKPQQVANPKPDHFVRADVLSTTKAVEENFLTFEHVPDLKTFGLQELFLLPGASEKYAQKRLANFLEARVYQYSAGRSMLAAAPEDDTLHGSSFLSPYLRFGMLSTRQAYWGAKERFDEIEQGAERKSKQHSVDAWINELVWREFYMHILYYFPHVTKGNFRSQYDSVEWQHSPQDLEIWKAGMTGYPVVDAAMRQLTQMGWMPNRARMIVASFLTKDLLIDWKEGERHFMDWLIDGDPAANNGGWQWSAGTGTDAQPYFRIFNPVLQSKQFDPHGIYIRRWIPELRDVPERFIHAPREMSLLPTGYPAPMVDHKQARQQTLAAFGAQKGNKIT